MNNIKVYSLFIGILLIYPCRENKVDTLAVSYTNKKLSQEKTHKIQVLNFGTFHMAFTTDAHTTEFDEHDRKNQKQVHEIAKQLAAFKPTVIVVERTQEYNEKLQAEYNKYLENPASVFNHPSEIEL